VKEREKIYDEEMGKLKRDKSGLREELGKLSE
jgi:hypothetical protein